jgi:hypothetical protein
MRASPASAARAAPHFSHSDRISRAIGP